MGYADEIMKLKDGDGDAEVYIERLPGDAEDGSVLEVEVAIGAGSGRREGYIRLGRESLSKLAEWLATHDQNLSNVEWAKESAAEDERRHRDAAVHSAIRSLLSPGGVLTNEERSVLEAFVEIPF